MSTFTHTYVGRVLPLRHGRCRIIRSGRGRAGMLTIAFQDFPGYYAVARGTLRRLTRRKPVTKAKKR